eukprot:8885304-Pyramimonas_sp.AAC.1
MSPATRCNPDIASGLVMPPSAMLVGLRVPKIWQTRLISLILVVMFSPSCRMRRIGHVHALPMRMRAKAVG